MGNMDGMNNFKKRMYVEAMSEFPMTYPQDEIALDEVEIEKCTVLVDRNLYIDEPPFDISQSGDLTPQIMVGLHWLEKNLTLQEWSEYVAWRLKKERI